MEQTFSLFHLWLYDARERFLFLPFHVNLFVIYDSYRFLWTTRKW